MTEELHVHLFFYVFPFDRTLITSRACFLSAMFIAVGCRPESFGVHLDDQEKASINQECMSSWNAGYNVVFQCVSCFAII